MPVPDFQSLMLPVLRALADGKSITVREVRKRVASRRRPYGRGPAGDASTHSARNRSVMPWRGTYLFRQAVMDRKGHVRVSIRRRVWIRLFPSSKDVGDNWNLRGS